MICELVRVRCRWCHTVSGTLYAQRRGHSLVLIGQYDFLKIIFIYTECSTTVEKYQTR
jgi:hypothetical protein